jgi:hypothetical protein
LERTHPRTHARRKAEDVLPASRVRLWYHFECTFGDLSGSFFFCDGRGPSEEGLAFGIDRKHKGGYYAFVRSVVRARSSVGVSLFVRAFVHSLARAFARSCVGGNFGSAFFLRGRVVGGNTIRWSLCGVKQKGKYKYAGVFLVFRLFGSQGHACLRSCVRSFVFVCSVVLSFVRSFVCLFVRACVCPCARACVLRLLVCCLFAFAFVRSFVRACVGACVCVGWCVHSCLLSGAAGCAPRAALLVNELVAV